MFELNKSDFGAYELYQFIHPQTGSGFDIVPGCGSNVISIKMAGKEILDAHRTAEDLAAGSWSKSAVLFPFPNRLRSGRYQWNGIEYVFPINNAATQNAIHGFVQKANFELVQTQLESDAATIICRYTHDGSNPSYPFLFELDLRFSFHLPGTFTMGFTVRNTHHHDIPFGLGWHPYFNLGGTAQEHKLKLPPSSMVEIDSVMIPTGARTPYAAFNALTTINDTFLDNCFEAGNNPGESYTLQLESSSNGILLKAPVDQFPFFQVFTPPHHQSVALEPMTCNVDALNNGEGLIRLESGKEWSSEFSIEYYSK
jgi:aldose 1-epimerase